jgi:hypothetical protein
MAESQHTDDAASATSASEPAALPAPPPRAAKRVQAKVPLRPTAGLGGRTNARMTLFGTAVVFSVTFVAWGGAKAACNLHPPRSEAFAPAPLTRLAATPKDGALEFHHRLAIRDFDGAKELAAAGAVPLVERARAECDTECKNGAKERSEHLLTRAVVLRRQGPMAVVRAESFFDGNVETKTYRVTWEDRLWKVLGFDE